MTGQTVILSGPRGRALAHDLIDRAPQDAVVAVKPPTRTLDQNALFWSRLSDLSRAKPGGRSHTPEVWKALCMNACGYPVQFEVGLSGEPFPIGFRSSRLSKTQMSELIEFIHQYGAEHGVKWTLELA